jgi:outer membrane protein OmpA-like peptidoglycan-associated protein
VQSFLVFVFRLLLLGIGGGFALLLGMAIAQFFPAHSSRAPFLEGVFRQSGRLFNTVQNIRQPSPSPSSAALPTASPSTIASPVPSTVPSDESLAVPPAVTATSDTGKLVITLPTDALFNANEDVFRPEAQPILDSVVSDLKRYPGASVQVSAYTDSQPTNSTADVSPGTAQQQRNHSFTQAQVIKRYLANRAGDQYHWLVAGFGDTQPVVPNDTPINQKRNRRIQITIEPQ